MKIEKATPEYLQMLEDSINLGKGNYNVHTRVTKSLSGGSINTISDLITRKGKVSIGEGEEHKAYIKFKSEGYTKLAEIMLRRIKQTKPVEVLNPPNAKSKKVTEKEPSGSGWGRPRPIRNRRPSSQGYRSSESFEQKLERLGTYPFGNPITTTDRGIIDDVEDTPEALEF